MSKLKDRWFKALGSKPARKALYPVPYIPPRWIFAALPSVYRADRGGPATGLMEVRVTGKTGGTWTLDIRSDGVAVNEGPAPALPDARIMLDPKTWTALAAGRISGTEAFARGRIAAEGDLTLTLKLDAAFS